LNGIGEASREELSLTNRLYESAFLAIRSEGLSKARFMKNYGIDIVEVIQASIDSHIIDEFLILQKTEDDIIIRLNSKGFAICDEISLRMITALEEKMGAVWESTGYEEDDESLINLPII
jgi:hypothetical protein